MTISLSHEEKKDLILENEKLFCNRVSAAIVDKPQVAVWMILIPVFFVFYFWQLKKYSEGRKSFSNNFLITRQRALEVACQSVMSESEIKIDALVEAEDVPVAAREQYRSWVILLASHYKDLLLSKGESFRELVRSTYRSKKQYGKFIEELNKAEKSFNAKLKPHLEIAESDVKDIISRMEDICAALRQQELKEIYSSVPVNHFSSA